MPILKSEIAARIAYAEALTAGKTIFEWAKASPAAKDIDKLVREIIKNYEQQDIQERQKAVASADG